MKERLSALSRGELVGLVCLLAAALGGAGLWYVRSLPRPVVVTGSGSVGTGTAIPSPSPSPAVLIVDVAGWVRDPGVYEFHEGDRIIDAVKAAGGPRKDALLDSLNLAAPLTDGMQVLVPRAIGPPAGAATGEQSGSAVASKINVNTASATELEALPGVGEVIAQRIVDYRTENGPFPSVDALLDVSGIGPATLEEMRDLVTV